MAENQDLNALLDSALDDFKDVESLHRNQSSQATSSSAAREEATDSNNVPSQAPMLGEGLGISLPALGPKRKKAELKRGNSSKNATSPRHLSDTLEELTQQTKKTLQELDTCQDEEAMASKLVENIAKQFEELGTNEDMQSIMDTMMRQLLSKDVLHEPLKELGESYPGWLEANKAKISQDDYDRYNKQYRLINELCGIYETTPDDFLKIIDIMQHMQACGQPPNDLVQELAPGLNLSDDGLPMISELLQDNNGQPNCSIM